MVLIFYLEAKAHKCHQKQNMLFLVYAVASKPCMQSSIGRIFLQRRSFSTGNAHIGAAFW